MVPMKRTSRISALSNCRRRISSKTRMKLGFLGSSLCLLGFFLFAASLYSAIQNQNLQQKDPNTRNARKFEVIDFGFPNITIFSATRPFYDDGLDSVGARQEIAIRSWLRLSPNVNVVLFGQHPSVLTFASNFGNRVVVESGIDFTFLGTPFFHSMVARSQASHAGISLLVDPETILLPDIITTLHYVHKLNRDWFLTSVSSSIPRFPFLLDDTGQNWLQKDGKRIGAKKEFLVQNRQWRNCGERILMAWNTGDPPLHAGIIPPFAYNRGLHNEWLVNEVLSSDFRIVIDATLAAPGFYLESLSVSPSSKLNKTWEDEGNHHLASLYGSLYFRPNTTISFRLTKCSGQYCLFDSANGTVYFLNDFANPSWLSEKFLQFWRRKEWTNLMKDVHLWDRNVPCSKWHKVSFKMPRELSLSLSLNSLLQIIANKDKSVVLAVAGDNYRDMLMSWGLPVFKDPLAPSNISFDDCHFGTKCFQRVTKVKSRIVLQILKLGYNVLMSDVDVYWFENPMPFLHSFGSATLLAMSDEFNKTEPINLPRRLNSGFYFARSDPVTIAALKKVVKHASTSDLSEQPSFYDVLCGEGGANRVGDDRCFEPETKLTVIFLNRSSFPNGAYKGLWEKSNVRLACLKLGCVVLHNNWISGRKRKFERQLRSGLWDYDSSSRMCVQNWQRTTYSLSLE
ncbi:uncharacterized protein A4U43_C04F20130 [Asparagus officinalis]|uniref:Nucleotide-diphospho-sugar transferase domain-containing protein n=1 Tax=Asparagus officinalis TaxID=4686 RepID=A0A5P1F2B3_ASPOF|nr:uncharacterized protein A4U43_C04F20130 [Asparagus officinalis]